MLSVAPGGGSKIVAVRSGLIARRAEDRDGSIAFVLEPPASRVGGVRPNCIDAARGGPWCEH